MSIRLVVCVSDLHCGSTSALLPPGFVTVAEQQPVGQNAIQRWLWECWSHAWDDWLPSIVGTDPWVLVVLGDAMEGVHHKTREVISSDTADHHEAAAMVLEPLAKRAAQTFIVEGTECHTGTQEHNLARRLKATPDPDTGKPAFPRLELNVAGCRSVYQHHITVAIRTYLEASGIGIALGNEQLEAAKNGERITNVLTSAHRHRYGEVKDASGLSMVLPPWQMLTRHARKVATSARTRPGIAVQDWRGKPDGALPQTHVITFRPPEPKGVTI